MPIVNTPTQAPADEMGDAERILLMRAADIVAVRWQQHGYGNPGGPRCAMGAIYESAEKYKGEPAIAARQLKKFLNMSVVSWNDIKGRTAAEVSAAMRAAARTRP